MVATLNYVYAPVPVNRSQASAVPATIIEAANVVKTTADLATSVQTDVSDSSGFISGLKSSVLAIVTARAGPVWLEFGTSPTAVAASDGAHYLPIDTPRAFIMPNGFRIAAIDA